MHYMLLGWIERFSSFWSFFRFSDFWLQVSLTSSKNGRGTVISVFFLCIISSNKTAPEFYKLHEFA